MRCIVDRSYEEGGRSVACLVLSLVFDFLVRITSRIRRSISPLSPSLAMNTEPVNRLQYNSEMSTGQETVTNQGKKKSENLQERSIKK